MELEGMLVCAATCVCYVKACSMMEALEKGQVLHIEISKRGLEKELDVGTTLVHMYTKCGLLAEAHKLFQQLPIRSVAPWTALIVGYVENGFFDEALNCYEQMLQEGISLDANAFVGSLKACFIAGNVGRGQEIHAEIVQRGFEKELNVGTTLVDMYAKHCSLLEADALFDRLPDRDAALWTVLIAGYAENGLGMDVLKCFEGLQLDGVPLDSDMFVCSLKVCSNIEAIELGQALHDMICKVGFDTDVYVGNTLLDMYANCNLLGDASQVFDKLHVQDAVSWNALIAGYTEHGLSDEALRCFEQMQFKGLPPVALTFSCLVKACSFTGALSMGHEIYADLIMRGFEKETTAGNALVDMYRRCGSLAEARQVFDKLPVRSAASWTTLITGYAEHGCFEDVRSSLVEMQHEGVTLDHSACVFTLKCCGMVGASDLGRRLHADIVKKELMLDLFVGNTLLDMYIKCGLLAEAHHVFNKLPTRDAVSWNVLIAGYAENNLGGQVLDCLTRMRLSGVSLVACTLACSLTASSCFGALELGQEMHGEIIKKGYDGDMFLGHVLVDMYGKCSALAEGQKVLSRLPAQGIVPWNAMIKRCGENHEGHIAVQCFKEMQEQGVKPDAVTFTCLIVACSHSSLLQEGQEYYYMMQKYDIMPNLDHFTCMVDLLARSGQVYEAERFIAGMQCPPSKQIVTALLSACKVYGKVDVGERCFQQLVHLDQEEAATYLLMADIYASMGMWQDVKRVEEMRRLAGARKKPANTLLEVNQTWYNFSVSDSQSPDILPILEVLSPRMKGEGYVPNLDLVLKDITTAEKQLHLSL